MSDDEVRDLPLIIELDDRQLFGIVSQVEKPTSVGVVLLQANGNAFGGRTRFTLRLAHSLAARGVPVLRLDYEGTGESSGGVANLDSRAPAGEDVRAAISAFRNMGHEHVVLAGYCYGGAAALAGSQDNESVAAVVLMAPPAESRVKRATFVTVGRVARGALQPARWAALRHGSIRRRYKGLLSMIYYTYKRKLVPTKESREWLKPALLEGFVHGLTSLADRRVPTLLLLGEPDRTYETLQRADDPAVAAVLAPGASSIEVKLLHGGLHGLRDGRIEQAAIDSVTEWVADLAPRFAPERTLSTQ